MAEDKVDSLKEDILKKVFSDPNFHALPMEERMKGMRTILPNYADLPLEEQQKGYYKFTEMFQQSQVPTKPFLDLGAPSSPEDTTAASMGMFQPGNMQMPTGEQLNQDLQKLQGIPAQIGQGMVGQLPLAGMVVGGALGMPGGPAGAITGAGLGGGIGAYARGGIQRSLGLTPPQLPEQINPTIGKEMLFGSLAEGGGPLIGKALEKTILGPFAKYTEKVMGENALAKQGQQMVEQGIPISPDVISPSRTSRAVNWALENLWPANSIMASKRREIYDAAVQMKDSFAQQYGLGKTSKELVNQAWDNWAAIAGPETILPMTNTKAAIEKALEKPFAKGAFWDKYAKTFLEGEINVQGIRDLLATVKIVGAKGADRTARRAVVNAIKEDLPEGLATGLTNAQMESRALYRIEPIERIIRKAMIPQEGLEAALFSPAKFVQEWNFIKSKVGKRLSTGDIKLVDDFSQKMQAMIPDISRLGKYEAAKKAPTLSLQGLKTTVLGSPVGAVAASSQYPLLVLPIGAEVPLAYSLMNPTGLFRKWLTTGLKVPPVLSKMGTMKLEEEYLND